MKKGLLWLLLGVAVLIPYCGALYLNKWYHGKLKEIDGATFVVISKEEMMLRVFDFQGHEEGIFPIACGKNFGDKEAVGDMKTPEGVFHISEILPASNWSHDFGDGNGEIEGAYGPWFMRLEVPGHKGIGIHGTHKPESIGTRDTEGCIRLLNEDVETLKKMVKVGTTVVIVTSNEDAIQTLKNATE